MNYIDVAGRKVSPSKVVCVGRNYAAHIAELGNETPEEAVLFMKPNSAISDSLFVSGDHAVHYEGEIAFVVEQNILVGVGFGLDLTRRSVQSRLKEKGLPWERAKAFDGSAVFSSFVAVPDDLTTLSLRLEINGALKQAGGVGHMLRSPDTLLAEILTQFSLEDGDVILTGTPEGVGPLVPGEVFCGKIYSDKQLLVEHTWTVH
jgi:2-keto-4-pentenoate hydratase/2-oxohepta-3-ene-1,7-dioic acid hydratase in catechol pathway